MIYKFPTFHRPNHLTQQVTDVDLSQDGRHLTAVDVFGQIVVIDTGSGKVLVERPADQKALENPSLDNKVSFSRKLTRLAVGVRGKVVLFDLQALIEDEDR